MKTIAHSFKIGEPVSYAFNGDCYPDGVVAKITKRFLTTDGNRRYSLRTYVSRDYDESVAKYVDTKIEKFSSVCGGTWTLVHGHHNKRNPSF